MEEKDLTKYMINGKTLYYNRGFDQSRYTVYIKNNLKRRLIYGKKYQEIGMFNINAYPGCCGIEVLNSVVVLQEMRNQGYGNLLLQLVLKIHYCSQLQATTNGHSPEMDHLLKKYGFQVMSTFTNFKTGNTISLYYLNLDYYNG